jgi:outer membrane protein assembly factor BamB
VATTRQIDDPFDAIGRVHADTPGVRIWDEARAVPGVVIFHTIVDNKIVVVDGDGSIVMEFSETPPDYTLYRPGKAGDQRNVYCILCSTDCNTDRAVAALNEDGAIIWKTAHHHFTHDFHIRHNRRIVSVLRDDRDLNGRHVSDNVICDMDISGAIKWRWSVLDNLAQFEIADEVRRGILDYGNDNPFHVNSVQIADYPIVVELLGEPAIIASARNMNCVFIVGQLSNKVLFEYSGKTMGQHHARILHEEYPGVGHLMIVDNGYNFMPPNAGESRGYSRVLEIDLSTGETVWEYRSGPADPLFYSPIVGAQQRFPNGNTLITEGYYGRLFEIDYDGNIVWDYVHPEHVAIEEHVRTKSLRETGLRQVYRAYKVGYDWLE